MASRAPSLNKDIKNRHWWWGVRWEQHWDVNSGVRGQGSVFVIVVVISFLI